VAEQRAAVAAGYTGAAQACPERSRRVIPMQVIYHTSLAHGNPLAAKVVVLGHLHDTGFCLGGGGVADVVGGAGAEGVAVAELAGKRKAGRLGGREQTGPRCTVVLADLEVIAGNAGTGTIAAIPDHARSRWRRRCCWGGGGAVDVEGDKDSPFGLRKPEGATGQGAGRCPWKSR